MTKNDLWDSLYINGQILTCEERVGLKINGAIAVKNGLIAWIGSMSELKAKPETLAESLFDLGGSILTPGFIDCHTHIVYAGNRAHEFEERLQGKTYAEIARSGGGIFSTVRATRAASEEELLRQSIKRVQSLLKTGVTTLEIKSGYGLDCETELKMLRVAKKIESLLPVTIKTTFLGAHTVPPEYANNPNDYVDFLCEHMIPLIARDHLADAVDVFCETIAFNLAQTERLFRAAKTHGLAIKCHAEQLSSTGSASLAATYHALSADHLEHLTLAGIKAMSASGTVAVLLPGAFYFLRETKYPPIELLKQHQIPIALATDSNPGTSPILSMPLILNMACTLFRFTPEEALLGVTKHAAKALGLSDHYGTLTIGKRADFAIWDIHKPVELFYELGANHLNYLVKNGTHIRF